MTEILSRQALTKYGEALSPLEEELIQPEGSEVLVKIRHCGVCHSDLHLQDGFFSMGGEKKQSIAALHSLPHTLGHEIEGEIIAIGPNVSGITIGGRRVVYPWIGCGRCRNCTRQLEHLCDAPRSLGVARNGGFATHIKVPDAKYLLDYEGISSSLAGSLMCAGLTAYGALKKWDPFLPEANRLIIGLGGVGTMALLMSRMMFDKPPVIAEINPEKRKQALALGAADVFDPNDPRQMRDILRKYGWFDQIIDFVGGEKTVAMSIRLISKGGQLVVVGLYGGELKYPLPMLAQREVTLEGSYVCSLDTAKEMIDLIRKNSGISDMPIAAYPLAEANKAMNALRAGEVQGRLVLTND